MTPQRPRRRMTAKSPDTQDDGSAAAPSRSAGAGDSEQSETRTQLREAIADIDQRPAEAEDGADFDADYAKAKKTAMNMLAMRDHSREELRKKLLKRDLMSEAVDELIIKLENSRLLNDEEFAHRFVRAQRENRKLSRAVL